MLYSYHRMIVYCWKNLFILPGPLRGTMPWSEHALSDTLMILDSRIKHPKHQRRFYSAWPIWGIPYTSKVGTLRNINTSHSNGSVFSTRFDPSLITTVYQLTVAVRTISTFMLFKTIDPAWADFNYSVHSFLRCPIVHSKNSTGMS